MTTTNPPEPNTACSGGANGSAYASAASVAGLAREIDALRHDLTKLLTMPARLDELADLVAQLAEATAATCPIPATGVLSWLDLPAEADTAQQILGGLVDWLARIYLRYPDAAAGLPDCWAWHPDVIEELLWLWHAWLAAYHDTRAPVTAAADWHDRYRPGVVRRITTTAGRCSLENHQPRDHHTPPHAPGVPLTAAVNSIAVWWATDRDNPGPIPTPEHLADAAAHHRPGSRR
jgi:hypothetical protein